tara:strand:+ start:98 stop:271 length:174 start_codon:yes stop_codon:yes gene_type:complete
MGKDKDYETFNITTGLWEDEVESPILKRFRQDYELMEAEREIVTRLLQQMLNNEDVD